MRIVVTGGAGFIGSNLARYFHLNHDVLVVDSFRGEKTFINGNIKSSGYFKNLIDFKGDIYCRDICNNKTMQIIHDFSPDIIFHEAAISDTTVSEQNELMNVNVNTFYSLLILQKI